LSQSAVPGGLGWGAQFAMDFVGIGVGPELIEQVVGPFQFEDLVGGQEGRQASLPVIVAAFDFALGLGGGGVEEGHPVEVEGLAELGEGVGPVGEEEGVVVHVESQGQAIGLESSGEEVEVGQERLGGIESGAGVVTGGVVQQVEQDLFVGVCRQPGVGAGVVLPEGAPVADLPAFDGLGRLFVAGVGSQLVLDRPAADAGPVGVEVEATEQFTGASVLSWAVTSGGQSG